MQFACGSDERRLRWPGEHDGRFAEYGTRRVIIPSASSPCHSFDDRPAPIRDDADRRADTAREVGASLETSVRTVDRSRLLDVQRLASRHPGRIVEDDDSAHAFTCERMGACAPQFSSADDADGRHES